MPTPFATQALTPLKSFSLAQSARCVPLNERKAAFRDIYEKSTWVRDKDRATSTLSLENYYTQADPERTLRLRRSASGHGSDLGVATTRSLSFLREVIQNYSVRSMIDVPCGDANWQFESYVVDGIHAYAGLDIVPSVVDFNARRFAHHSNKRFAALDFAACELPRLRWMANASGPLAAPSEALPFELVHSRDVFQHMRTSSALRAIHHVVNSGARLFIATTFARTAGGVSRIAGRQREISVPHRQQARQPEFRQPYYLQGRPTSSLGSWLFGGRSGGRVLQEGLREEERDSPVVPVEGGFAHVDLSARPFVLPAPAKCVASHPTIEPDLTCLYVLSAEWKAEWKARRTRCGRPCTNALAQK
jgi:hypothetical protein